MSIEHPNNRIALSNDNRYNYTEYIAYFHWVYLFNYYYRLIILHIWYSKNHKVKWVPYILYKYKYNIDNNLSFMEIRWSEIIKIGLL